MLLKILKVDLFLSFLLLVSALRAATLTTTWGERVTSDNCWREYPRPQMERANWTCLNGDWDYAITSVTNTLGRPTAWAGKIRVPFAIESALSGVGKLLEPDQFLWYTRKITCAKRPGERILLHFGAADFRTMVFIGHQEVTDVPHEGGQHPFTLDITDYVTDGENELTVCVWDPTENFVNSRGKQSFKPSGCFYTRVSGIWQTVWMENVPEHHIRGVRIYPDIDAGTVRFEFDKVEGAGEVKVTTDLPKDFECWSPENPKLYHYTATYGRDTVRGYFGMRKIEKRKDSRGILRFFLNNRPYYLLGTLDQGWWPDGLLTPPSEAAMAFDIQTLKSCGFNMMRKHIKVEPLRYYYLCDKLGLLVIQDLVSGSGSPLDPARAKTVAGYGLQRQEMKEMMDLLQAVPSVVMWNPYNEGWSQPGAFLTHAMLDFVRRYDRTRLVNGPSGCWDWEGGQTLPRGSWKWAARAASEHLPADVCEAADTVDMHLYRHDNPDGLYGSHRIFAANDRRISFLGEFGGLGHPVEGHLFKAGSASWGYGGVSDTKTREGLEKTYLAMMDDLVRLVPQGLGGSIYTQTTDVEVEVNGLMTYDRKVLKFDPAVLKAAHAKIVAALSAQPAAPATAGTVGLPALFGDHAVIQRDTRASVWGRAPSGERVTVKLSTATAEAVAGEDGWFWTRLDTTRLGEGPFDLVVTAPSGEAVSHDVLVGEVWLAAGQSNMEMRMKGGLGEIFGYRVREERCANRPLRIFRARHGKSRTPVKGEARGAWTVISPETLPEVTAVGYCFIDTLQRRLGGPAAVVDISWSGTRCWAWLPRESLEAIPELAHERRLQESYFENDDLQTVRKPVSICWNNMFAPLGKLACRGILWYQGCCDSSMLDAETHYPQWMAQVVAAMRREMERPDLPFLYVQLAGWGDAPDSPACDKPRAHLREAQRLARKLIPNAHMAVSIDQSEKEIHNRGKSAVGDRLAALALNRVYGQKDVPCLSPAYASVAFEPEAAVVRFETEGSPLRAGKIRRSYPWDAKHAEEIPLTRRSTAESELEGFVIRDGDGTWHWADARIVAPDAVRVFAAGVRQPTAVRYAWGGQGFGSLENAAGLPAEPFTTERAR